MQEEFSYSYNLKRNTVNLFGAVNTEMAERVISQLQYLDDKFKKDDVPEEERIITLQINSPGGVVTDGLAIIDTMNYIEAKVMTVGVGLTASMGAVILACGEKGMRYATKNCEVLIHQPLGGAQGQASDIIIAATQIGKTRERLNKILAEATGQDVRRIKKDCDRDFAMTADEAMRYGLIDKVL